MGYRPNVTIKYVRSKVILFYVHVQTNAHLQYSIFKSRKSTFRSNELFSRSLFNQPSMKFAKEQTSANKRKIRKKSHFKNNYHTLNVVAFSQEMEKRKKNV